MRVFVLVWNGKYLTAKGIWSSDKTKAERFTLVEVNNKISFYSTVEMNVTFESL